MNIYDEITRQIVEAIERGVGAVQMPWHSKSSFPRNPISGTNYQGINTLILWATAEMRQFTDNRWATYKQWREIGAQVRKAEKGTSILYYQKLERENDESPAFVARAFTVFNVAQVDGFEDKELGAPLIPLSEVEAFVKGTGACINYGGDMAAYLHKDDRIVMPPRSAFFGTMHSTPTESFYSVLFHELTHWTGPKHRLDRDMGKRFGDQSYAMEELVAELGAAFLSAEFGLSSSPREDHASYIKNWLSVFKSDNRALFAASGKAREAVKFLRQTE